MSQIYAGDGYGSTWVPEVDTEVLVGFAHGDMRWPYVVGCLHSDTDAPPESRTSSSDVKTLRTPGGSELRLRRDQRDGGDQDPRATPRSSSRRTAGAITIKGSQKITLDAPEIEISGSSKVTIKGGEVAIN